MRKAVASPDHFPTAATGLPTAQPPTSVEPADGAQFDLRIGPVAKLLGGTPVRMLAYNGSVPGPTLRVRQGTALLVNVVNEGDLEATVHWHGLRLDNRYDGTTETQPPIPVSGAFTYRLTFPDPGVYWYHPHIREDYGQEMGLYGNIVVEPRDQDYWPPVNRDLTVTLDDILLEDGGVAPFDRRHPTHTAMGRFGNTLLVNGEPELSLQARHGEVVRFYLTNTANTRVFNVGFRGARMKLVGGDSGRYEREAFVDGVVVAPSERAVVDVLFEQRGPVVLEHRTPRRTYTLATITVDDTPAQPSFAIEYEELRTDADIATDRSRIASYLAAAPDKTLALIAEMDIGESDLSPGASVAYVCPMHPDVTSAHADRCPQCGMKLVPARVVSAAAHGHREHGHSPAGDSREHGGVGSADSLVGVEWEDDMVDVNRVTNPSNMRWKLIVDDDRIEIAVGGRFSAEPSRASRIDSDAFRTLERTIRSIVPDAVIAPYLVVVVTDARHYADLSENIFRFLPLRLGSDDLKRMHGIDERVGIRDYETAVRTYRQLIMNAAGDESPGRAT